MDQLYQQAVLIAPRTHYPATTDDCGGHEREPVGVHIHSGADGALLGTVTGAGPEQLLGYSVDSAGDINNDGRDDLFMGSPALPEDQAGRAFIFFEASPNAIPTDRSCAVADVILDPTVAGDTLFGLFTALGNDVDNDGEADLVVHAGFDSTGDGELDSTRGYMFSGADGSLLYTFTTDDEPDPPNNPGDTDGVDLIEIILFNYGMEDATADDGDLNDDGRVDATDLALAVDQYQAESDQQGDPLCLQLPDVDGDPAQWEACEEGEGGPPNPGPFPPDPGDGFWDPCADMDVPTDPSNPDECIVWAYCTASQNIADEWNNLSQQKMNAEAARDDAVGEANNDWQGSSDPTVIMPNSPRAIAERQRADTIQHARRAKQTRIRTNNITATATSTVSLLGAIGSGGTLGVFIVLANTGVLVALKEDNAFACEMLEFQVNSAQQAYLNNPARQAFQSAIAQAQAQLQQACADIQAQEDQLQSEQQDNYNDLLNQCLQDL